MVRNDEIHQSVERLAKSVAIVQRDVGKLGAHVTPEVVVELSPEMSKSDLEPGEIRCGCKRLRR